MAIFTLTLFIGFTSLDVCADDVKPTQEQQLVLEIEKVKNVRDYTKEKMQILKDQFGRLNIVYVQADQDLRKLETQLKTLKAKEGGK